MLARFRRAWAAFWAEYVPLGPMWVTDGYDELDDTPCHWDLRDRLGTLHNPDKNPRDDCPGCLAARWTPTLENPGRYEGGDLPADFPEADRPFSPLFLKFIRTLDRLDAEGVVYEYSGSCESCLTCPGYRHLPGCGHLTP